ncbi:MAG: 23S rRNA (pseudouridine(1915)-N(3))-methyltransferase RlmH [Verrucomicrobiota bacterium]
MPAWGREVKLENHAGVRHYPPLMKICVLLPGKIKPKVLSAAQEEYAKRLKAFGVEIAEYKDEKVSSRTPEQTKQAEAERIFKLLKEGDYLVACDERGEKIQTLEMAELLRASRQGAAPVAGKRRMVIVVGGALGLAETIRQRADAVWSLSSLVMAGGVARIVLLEGIYRAFTVVDNHPYHNE